MKNIDSYTHINTHINTQFNTLLYAKESKTVSHQGQNLKGAVDVFLNDVITLVCIYVQL